MSTTATAYSALDFKNSVGSFIEKMKPKSFCNGQTATVRSVARIVGHPIKEANVAEKGVIHGYLEDGSRFVFNTNADSKFLNVTRFNGKSTKSVGLTRDAVAYIMSKLDQVALKGYEPAGAVQDENSEYCAVLMVNIDSKKPSKNSKPTPTVYVVRSAT